MRGSQHGHPCDTSGLIRVVKDSPPRAVLQRSVLPAWSATAVSTAASAATTTTAVAAETTTTAALRLGTRFIYVESTAVHFGAVELHDGCFGIALFRHFDEGEAARLAGVPIRYDVHTLDITVLLKSRQQVVLSRLETEVPHEYVCHFLFGPVFRFVFVRLLWDHDR